MPELVNIPTSITSAVPGLDASAARRWRQLARTESPWLHEEVAARMVQRLQWFREPPPDWLHWEPVVGGLQAHAQLRERLPQASWHLMADRMDLALTATRAVAGRSWNPLQWRRQPTPQHLPPDGQVGMLWANMALHQEAQPQDVLSHWHGLIRTNGFLMFSCLGPDSLRELRTVYAQAGWPDPAHAFTDMHDWGDMLMHSGFAEPVMDMERITLTYSNATALLQELRGMGRNLNQHRYPNLRGRTWRAGLLQALETQLPRDVQGRLLLSFEIIYGHAYKPTPRPANPTSQSVSLDAMRAMLREGRG